jgi:hypothetical protein
LIAFAIPGHHAGLGQLSQAGANRCGAQAAEFAQLLYGDGLIEAGQDLVDALQSRRFRTGLGNGFRVQCDLMLLDKRDRWRVSAGQAGQKLNQFVGSN